MHFRSRERNDHSEYVRSRERSTNVWTFRSRNETAYSNFRALERLSEPNEEKDICNKFKMIFADTIRYDTRCYFNVRSKADMSRFNLPHGNDN